MDRTTLALSNLYDSTYRLLLSPVILENNGDVKTKIAATQDFTAQQVDAVSRGFLPIAADQFKIFILNAI